jgi:hypothetical protein
MPPGQPASRRSPLLLGLLALGLMVGGYLLSVHRPAIGSDQAYPRPLHQVIGLLAVYTGALLFVVAGIAMYRRSAPPEDKPPEGESGEDDAIDADLREG